jgi:hypothetical protein
MATSKCTECKETVYPLERTVLAEQVFHKGCAKCSHCQGTLSIASFASVNGRLFCKPHYIELFKSSGGKYTLTRDGSGTGAAERPESTEVKQAPRESTPKRLSKVASLLGVSSAEKPSSAKKESNLWKKSMDVFGRKGDKQAQEKATEVPAEKLENETVTSRQHVEVKPAEIQSKTEHVVAETKPVKIAPTSGMSKLSMFLTAESAPAAVAAEPVVAVEEKVQEHKSTAHPVQNQSGLSKLSMFLQQVEAPSVNASAVMSSVKSVSNIVNSDTEVVKERQASVSELIKKTTAKPAESKQEITKVAKPLIEKEVSKPAAAKEDEIISTKTQPVAEK